MKICYVYQDQYPWDIRVEKITEALAEADMDVHIVCRNRTGVAPTEQLADRIQVHRVAQGVDRWSRTILNFPAFFSPPWIRKTVATVKGEGVDVIIVRDLPLGPMACCAGRLTGTPVIMDMAENYPAMLEAVGALRRRTIIDCLCRNPWLLRKMEQWLFPRLDGFLVVSEPSARRVRALAGSRTPVYIVGNTPRLRPDTCRASHPLLNRLSKRTGLVMLYVGGLEEMRGLETVIDAMPEITRLLDDFLFVVVGEGSSLERLKGVARAKGVEQHVLFAGWLDQRLVPAIIAESDVCIVPHYVTEHTNTTLPNKLFDYMLQKKPVLVTQAETLRHIVESCRCGLVYPDKDAGALARAVLKLAHPETRRVLGDAGFAAVQHQYNWDRDKQVLLEAVAVAGRRAAAASVARSTQRDRLSA